MASDLNRVIFIGRFTKDPELRHTPNGTAVANFVIANNRTYNSGNEKKEETSFFSCIAWSKLGELVVQYCKKGNRVGIEGRLQQRSWEDQNGNKRYSTEVVVENLQFLSPKESSAGQVQSGNTSYIPPSDIEDNPFSDDDIPF